MIPARFGSQRLKQKNLQLLVGIPLITHAIRKTKKCGVFNEVWVNSEADVFGKIAQEEGVSFHKRPAELANNQATSEDFVYEFLKLHACDYLVQVHSIAPLLSIKDILIFVDGLKKNEVDVLLSVEKVQIECAYQDTPVNFNYREKTNSQELSPIQKITWSITAWKRDTYLQAYESGKCATYSGKVGYYALNRLAAHIIKTQEDLDIAEALYHLVNK